MPIGAGKLFSGSNANRLRGDGTPTSAFSITTTVPDHRSFRYDISTTYAEGAELYVLLMFNQQIYPELFGYSFDTVGTDTYKLSANVTIDANGEASINSSINLHQLTNTANTIAFNSPTIISASVRQGSSSGPEVAFVDQTVTLKKDTQDEVEIINNYGNPVGLIQSVAVSDWDDYFPAAVDEGWDSTDFNYIRTIRSLGATGGVPNNLFFKWSRSQGSFNEPLIPSTNKDLPVHAVIRGDNKNNSDLYLINSPALEEMWLGRQFSPSSQNLDVDGADTFITYLQGNLGGSTTALASTGSISASYPSPPNVPWARPAFPGDELGFWYPLRGPDGEFITANAT
tara:strand:+ start:1222 stop:2247 length:1026 start_codon:yes stop_codon:yes gene_type:complete